LNAKEEKTPKSFANTSHYSFSTGNFSKSKHTEIMEEDQHAFSPTMSPDDDTDFDENEELPPHKPTDFKSTRHPLSQSLNRSLNSQKSK